MTMLINSRHDFHICKARSQCWLRRCIAMQDLVLLSQKGGGNVSAELMEVQRKAKANGAVNHYKVLGLQQTALPSDVKVSYRCADLRAALTVQSIE